LIVERDLVQRHNMTLKIAIIIPARYGSTRLEGKPLIRLAGQTMLQRVAAIARAAAAGRPETQCLVATDDARIAAHCEEIGIQYAMTPAECPSGTDRVAKAVETLPQQPDFILNLQGDAPFTPPDFLQAMIDAFIISPCDVVTPVTQLDWAQLDTLREQKKNTPSSGTCAVFSPHNGHAYWFSKNIIPAIRNEEKLRASESKSPVFRHIGLYGYSLAMLRRYSSLKESHFETLEGLEQLRMLENGYHIRCVQVDYAGRPSMSGIDSPEDVRRAENLLK